MKREEALRIAKPILFNTDMVRAIQNGIKTVTRRVVKSKKFDLNTYSFAELSMNPSEIRIDRDGIEYPCELKGLCATFEKDGFFPLVKASYQVGDILYVRETWTKGRWSNEKERYYYRADNEIPHCRWEPSIHMPKEAARIFLRVTGVRAERLQDIDNEQRLKEGIRVTAKKAIDLGNDYKTAEMGRDLFAKLWNSTVKKSDLAKYSWAANPWVWVIEFERVEVF